MDVFEAAKIAREYVKENAPRSAVQFTRVVAVNEDGEALTFDFVDQAMRATAGGPRVWIFDCIYRNACVEVKPAN